MRQLVPGQIKYLICWKCRVVEDILVCSSNPCIVLLGRAVLMHRIITIVDDVLWW